MRKYDAFTTGYIDCALWTEEEELGDAVLSYEALEQLTADARDFQAINAALLAQAEQAGRPLSHLGHDFWLTRNGHGVGFWDRGLGEVGHALSAVAESYGVCALYVGDDGLVYAS